MNLLRASVHETAPERETPDLAGMIEQYLNNLSQMLASPRRR